MIKVEEKEQVRRAYFVEHKSIRQIARESHHSRRVVRRAIESAEPSEYTQRVPRAAPVLDPYKKRIDELLNENERLPRKQRYTGHKIYTTIHAEGYRGSEPSVRHYIGQQRGEKKRTVYVPLEFDPGQDAQVDWGEGEVVLGGEPSTVQLFFMRLCYSRRTFVMAFPAQKQEAFFEGHVHAFHYFQGVPHRITYDNLKTAILRILQGRNREEQQAFIVFRSHYLFESHYCTPGEGHEKGGVEHSVGFDRRNFLVPLPEVASFEELNRFLLAQCQADDARQVTGQPTCIGDAWQKEQPLLRPLPAHDLDCCLMRPARLTPYSQVIFETNRYSVPTDQAYADVRIKAYPFHLQVLHSEQVLADHPRCYGRGQDIFDPLHYLPLLEQRPGAFVHAKPMRRWREGWPAVYEQLLTHLCTEQPDGAGLREFVQILNLHREHPAEQIEQAIRLALGYGCAGREGVLLCLHQLQHPVAPFPALDLSDQPQLVDIGTQPLELSHYNQLLEVA